MRVLFAGDVSQDYHQIYLCDGTLPALPDHYSDETIADRVMSGPEAIIVHVERELSVPVRVELHDERPNLDLTPYDHVTATALRSASGELVLAGLLADTATAARLTVPAGNLAVLVTFEALDSLSVDGFDGTDRYTIHLWPDQTAASDVIVVKRYPPAGLA